jgi:hypothetical protein
MKYIFAVLVVAAITSCDPMRRINIKNTSAEDAEISWKIKEDSIRNSPFYISNSDEETFTLKPKKPFNELKMSFGIGLWTPGYVKRIADDLDWIKIKSSSGTIQLTSQEDLVQFLMARRRGIANRKIVILVQ